MRPVEREKSVGPAPTPRRDGAIPRRPRRPKPWHDAQPSAYRLRPSAPSAGELGVGIVCSPGAGATGSLLRGASLGAVTPVTASFATVVVAAVDSAAVGWAAVGW